ncbi:MAG: hypothetical protein HGA45_30665 [Chloroflexales bacterium]|nr:hypothetical protein [Chloroflexales bacterium]
MASHQGEGERGEVVDGRGQGEVPNLRGRDAGDGLPDVDGAHEDDAPAEQPPPRQQGLGGAEGLLLGEQDALPPGVVGDLALAQVRVEGEGLGERGGGRAGPPGGDGHEWFSSRYGVTPLQMRRADPSSRTVQGGAVGNCRTTTDCAAGVAGGMR